MHLSQAVTGPMMYALAAEYHSFDTPEHQEFVNRFLEK
jgi:hypothetical protein